MLSFYLLLDISRQYTRYRRATALSALLIVLLSLTSGVAGYAQSTDCTQSAIEIELPLPADAFTGTAPPDGVILVTPEAINQYLQNQDPPQNPPTANTPLVLYIPADDYVAAKFENLTYCQTTIKIDDRVGAPAGEATFAGYNIDHGDPADPTIQILNCHRLELDGNKIKVLDAYGTGIPDGMGNQVAVNIGQASSYIDIHHLDIQNPSGFAGIMAKDSPGSQMVWVFFLLIQ